ncbi:MAG: hypothetical protein ABIR92_03180 [Gemmatimonadaceae bacterium]
MRAFSLRVVALAALTVAAGCDRSATEPVVGSGTGGRSLLTLLGAPMTVNVVTRDTPLPAPLSASATIGVLGGVITLPGAGLKVVVPALSLTKSTNITVTAVAGNQLAYEFQPHGIRFLVPLVVTQNLVGTSALSGGLLPQPLSAGYFANLSDLDPLAGTGLVTELLGTTVSLVTKTVTFSVVHFSGYLIATGKESQTSGEESAGQ